MGAERKIGGRQEGTRKARENSMEDLPYFYVRRSLLSLFSGPESGTIARNPARRKGPSPADFFRFETHAEEREGPFLGSRTPERFPGIHSGTPLAASPYSVVSGPFPFSIQIPSFLTFSWIVL